MNGNGGDPAISEAIPRLETQAAEYAHGLGLGDVSMDHRSLSISSSQSYLHAMSSIGSATGAEDYTMDSTMSRNPTMDSRRSSASAGGPFSSSMVMSSSMHSGAGNMSMSDMSSSMMMPSGTMTPDLSSYVQDKLSFLDSLANSVAQARAEVLRGDRNAADDHISDVGNAILEKALVPSQASDGTLQPPLNLNLPVLGEIMSHAVTPSPGPQETSPSTPTPAPSLLTSTSPSTLAPPPHLKRTNSVKRSAPESPIMEEESGTMNKHMRLDDTIMDTSEQPVPSVNMVLPPPLVHSHSYPNGHQLPSQMSASSAATILGSGTPVTASSSNFTAQLAPPLHVPPHVPSPLSAAPMSAQDSAPSPSPESFNYGNINQSNSIMQPTTAMWQAHPGLLTTSSYPGTPLETVPEAGVFVPVQQPGATSRRGSIVDGRLIAGRPTNLLSMTGGEVKSASTSAIPTMTSLSQMKQSGSPEPDGMDEDGDSDSGSWYFGSASRLGFR